MVSEIAHLVQGWGRGTLWVEMMMMFQYVRTRRRRRRRRREWERERELLDSQLQKYKRGGEREREGKWGNE